MISDSLPEDRVVSPYTGWTRAHWEYLADAQVTGIVLGARVPIVLTSRADSPQAHTASCALALLLAHSRQRTKP